MRGGGGDGGSVCERGRANFTLGLRHFKVTAQRRTHVSWKLPERGNETPFSNFHFWKRSFLGSTYSLPGGGTLVCATWIPIRHLVFGLNSFFFFGLPAVCGLKKVPAGACVLRLPASMFCRNQTTRATVARGSALEMEIRRGKFRKSLYVKTSQVGRASTRQHNLFMSHVLSLYFCSTLLHHSKCFILSLCVKWFC